MDNTDKLSFSPFNSTTAHDDALLLPHNECEIRELIKTRRQQMIEVDANFANSPEALAGEKFDRDATIQATANLSDNKPGQTSEQVVKPTPATPNSWPKPIPLKDRAPPLEYPIELLPEVLQKAILAVQKVTQAPLPMVASSALSSLAAATQGLVNVSRDIHLTGPTSLFFLILGDSGERKSSVDNFLSKPIQIFQQNEKLKKENALNDYLGIKDVWEAKKEQIKAQLKTSSASNKGNGDEASLKERLQQLYKEEPKRPYIPDLLITDITMERLGQHLSEEWPSVLLSAAEGGLLLGSRSMSKENSTNTLAVFNALWSQDDYRVARKTMGCYNLKDTRLSVSIFVQGDIFEDFIKKNPLIRSIGFLARCLFTFPQSTQGSRLYKEPTENIPEYIAYCELIQKLLNLPLSFTNRKLSPPAIPLSASAKKIWIQYHDTVEKELCYKGKYANLKDFASKTAENAARLAAIFQMCGKLPLVEIDEDSMEAGCAVADYHLYEAKRYFDPIETHLKNAEALEKFIIHQCKKSNSNSNSLLRKYLLQYGPQSTRNKDSLDVTLNYLLSRQHIRVSADNRIIEINPLLLNGAINE